MIVSKCSLLAALDFARRNGAPMSIVGPIAMGAGLTPESRALAVERILEVVSTTALDAAQRASPEKQPRRKSRRKSKHAKTRAAPVDSAALFARLDRLERRARRAREAAEHAEIDPFLRRLVDDKTVSELQRDGLNAQAAARAQRGYREASDYAPMSGEEASVIAGLVLGMSPADADAAVADFRARLGRSERERAPSSRRASTSSRTRRDESISREQRGVEAMLVAGTSPERAEIIIADFRARLRRNA